jgi:glycopeptide antibiotics resistance protein
MRRQLKSWILLVLYCLILFSILVFKQVPMIRAGGMMFDFGGTQDGPPNLIPFKTIMPYLLGDYGLLIGGLNLAGNIVLLIPFGLIVPAIYRPMRFLTMLLVASLFCLSIESIQALLKIGIFDIDDVILNGLGVMIGYAMHVWMPVLWQKMKSDRMWMAGSLATACLLIFLSIYIVRESLKPPPMQPGMMMLKDQSSKGPQSSAEDDLCRGTGGTGEIIAVKKDGISIRRKDGVVQQIKLTAKTVIKTSSGDIQMADLKPGNRVTLVIDETETAALVLVCGGLR